jgi:hypothetical protein
MIVAPFRRYSLKGSASEKQHVFFRVLETPGACSHSDRWYGPVQEEDQEIGSGSDRPAPNQVAYVATIQCP